MKRPALTFAIPALCLATASVAVAEMPAAAQWDIGPWVRGRNYSVGMPAHPTPGANGSVSFAFPRTGSGEIDAMTTAVYPLDGAQQLTMRYRIDAPAGTRFVPSENPEQTATVSLYFQRARDTWTAKGKYASYRWYVPARAVIPLAPGEHTVTVRFDERWTNVNGQPNSSDPAGFRAALRDTSQIGIAFGWMGRRSHGVHATGPARFTLLDLDIR